MDLGRSTPPALVAEVTQVPLRRTRGRGGPVAEQLRRRRIGWARLGWDGGRRLRDGPGLLRPHPPNNPHRGEVSDLAQQSCRRAPGIGSIGASGVCGSGLQHFFVVAEVHARGQPIPLPTSGRQEGGPNSSVVRHGDAWMLQSPEIPARPPVEPRYGSVADVSKYSGLSQKFIRNLIDSGELKSHKIGRRVLIAFADFDRYVESKPR
jgi:excisionase family DNA binding protein